MHAHMRVTCLNIIFLILIRLCTMALTKSVEMWKNFHEEHAWRIISFLP